MDQEKAMVYRAAGERIRRLRTKKGSSREGMAMRIGISGKFLYEIEKGKKGFTSGVLVKIADYLNVGCDYIMTGKVISDRYNATLFDEMFRLDWKQREYLKKVLDMQGKEIS